MDRTYIDISSLIKMVSYNYKPFLEDYTADQTHTPIYILQCGVCFKGFKAVYYLAYNAYTGGKQQIHQKWVLAFIFRQAIY